MKAKMAWKTICLIGIPALILIASGVFFIVSRKKASPQATPSSTPAVEQPDTPATRTQTPTQTQEDEITGNLMAWADDRASAEKIADLYGITLLFYENHIALYWSDKTPETLIQTGKENGWPELSKINPVTKYETTP